MKTTTPQIKLDKTKLFGFNYNNSGRSETPSQSAKPMMDSKTVGGKVTAFSRPMIGSKTVGSKVD